MARRRGMPAAKMNSYLPRSRFGGRGLFVFNRGPVAQLGARSHGMEEVVGRSPPPLPKVLLSLLPLPPENPDCGKVPTADRADKSHEVGLCLPMRRYRSGR